MKTLETFGSLTKEEILKTVDFHIVPNTFVLENLEPYPGYHGKDMPVDKKPDTFFLITQEGYTPEAIFRMAHNIRHMVPYNFDACYARLTIENEVYNSIRIKELNSYDPIEELQRSFMHFDVRFQKTKNIETTALIELKKIFYIEPINEYIFKDTYGVLFYIKIPIEPDIKLFKEFTRWVKNNMDNHNFDAALVVVYAKEVYDFIRIYDKNAPTARLEEIRQKYLQAIKAIC